MTYKIILYCIKKGCPREIIIAIPSCRAKAKKITHDNLKREVLRRLNLPPRMIPTIIPRTMLSNIKQSHPFKK